MHINAHTRTHTYIYTYIHIYMNTVSRNSSEEDKCTTSSWRSQDSDSDISNASMHDTLHPVSTKPKAGSGRLRAGNKSNLQTHTGTFTGCRDLPGSGQNVITRVTDTQKHHEDFEQRNDGMRPLKQNLNARVNTAGDVTALDVNHAHVYSSSTHADSSVTLHEPDREIKPQWLRTENDAKEDSDTDRKIGTQGSKGFHRGHTDMRTGTDTRGQNQNENGQNENENGQNQEQRKRIHSTSFDSHTTGLHTGGLSQMYYKHSYSEGVNTFSSSLDADSVPCIHTHMNTYMDESESLEGHRIIERLMSGNNAHMDANQSCSISILNLGQPLREDMSQNDANKSKNASSKDNIKAQSLDMDMLSHNDTYDSKRVSRNHDIKAQSLDMDMLSHNDTDESKNESCMGDIRSDDSGSVLSSNDTVKSENNSCMSMGRVTVRDKRWARHSFTWSAGTDDYGGKGSTRNVLIYGMYACM
jgi:hypothetical protein